MSPARPARYHTLLGEFAGITGRDISTLQRHAKRKHIDAFKDAGRWFTYPEAIDEYMNGPHYDPTGKGRPGKKEG